ncbi:hypothetical protein OG458_40690 [Streptomyces sp. NBC_01281]|uniref:hypothetical protein n=1 Tax=unclassified Streptomyces TaxID=2593676 RepID=UPI0013BD8075|nr:MULTISPECIES: hypothetical protein [unclassified Streptomyces]NEB33135.1 hypothetical protein [Streptomyces sp. SID14446]WSK65722.1 hypothetical protein OG458_40690 [Streptomyces sp. NBC_01281]
MRTRTAAASAALILSTLLGTAACTSSPEGDRSASGSSSAEKASSRQENKNASTVAPSACATTSDQMPAGCEIDLDVSEIDVATPATEPPATNVTVVPAGK